VPNVDDFFGFIPNDGLVVLLPQCRRMYMVGLGLGVVVSQGSTRLARISIPYCTGAHFHVMKRMRSMFNYAKFLSTAWYKSDLPPICFVRTTVKRLIYIIEL
jgi:hypothetical protein